MKSLDRWLRLRHPLLWNMRLHWMLPLLLLLHLLFYAVGRGTQYAIQQLGQHNFGEDGLVYGFSVLFSILIVLGWLIFYLRNNALKSRYPVSAPRLALEFLLTLLLLFGAITPYLSYTNGKRDALRAIISDTDLQKELLVMARGAHLLPFSVEDFSPRHDCDAQPANTIAPGEPAESMPYTAPDSGKSFSYLHFCSNSYGLFQNYDMRYQADADVKRWLLEGKRDSVEFAIRQYLALCDKYGAEHRLDPAAQTAEIFATPGFLVRTSIDENAYHSEQSNEVSGGKPTQFVEHYVLAEALRNGQNLSLPSELGRGYLLPWLTVSMIMSILLFTFRCTSLRGWITAVIGLGIWGILYALFSFSIGSKDGMETVWLLWVLVMAAIAISRILARRNKTLAGLAHLWWFWMTPLFIPVLLDYLATMAYRRSEPELGMPMVDTRPQFWIWVSEHQEAIWTLNLGAVILIAVFIWIPLARRWQAVPEE